jgi:hypothetical protein
VGSKDVATGADFDVNTADFVEVAIFEDVAADFNIDAVDFAKVAVFEDVAVDFKDDAMVDFVVAREAIRGL